MGQCIPNRDVLLAIGRVFRPVHRNRRIVLQQAAFGLNMDGSRRRRLRDRISFEKRVTVDCAAAVAVCETGPTIYYQPLP
jgi:hypothetical protein